ncbi:NAD(P)-binding protein [Actinomycetospora rhizophila]|uniref:NAD(P)-binding protein n=1 Tax=Actinomycetospora rhizophila TaxID=1416876 RepID=A0ABV9ZL28_9PSEU
MLGAGITGLVSASILLVQGAHRVLLIDEYPQVGGNHLDWSVGEYTFDVGSLIFQDDSPLLRHFPEILPRYVPIEPSWSKINPQGTVTRYPFSLREDFLAAGLWECLRLLGSALLARVAHRRMRNARDFARRWIGTRMLRRSGLENYMERFCGLPAERIDLSFAQKRMLWIAENAKPGRVIRSGLAALCREEPSPPTNQQLARPPEGFGELYAPAVAALEERGAQFMLGAKPRRVARTSTGFTVDVGDRVVSSTRLVSTIPVDSIRELCGLDTKKHLPTVTLITLFFSFAGRRGFDDSILYNFSHEGAWKRLTVYSDFYGLRNDREYFAVEVISGTRVATAEQAEYDFRRHVVNNGLFLGDLVAEGHHVLTNAYPVYSGGAGERAAKAIAQLREWGVESFGRQGAFEYQPTARVSTIHAEEALAAGASAD